MTALRDAVYGWCAMAGGILAVVAAFVIGYTLLRLVRRWLVQ